MWNQGTKSEMKEAPVLCLKNLLIDPFILKTFMETRVPLRQMITQSLAMEAVATMTAGMTVVTMGGVMAAIDAAIVLPS